MSLFQLEILVDGDHVPVTQSKFLDLLFNQAQSAKSRDDVTGYRIFKADRKRLKSNELAGGPKPAPKRPAPGVTDALTLGKRMGAWWRDHNDSKVIHVYPLGKTANGVSNQFRLGFFSTLIDITKGWPNESDRIKAERLAVEAGYTIIEVDPDEPALEEAA
jgi:hypothetical protein